LNLFHEVDPEAVRAAEKRSKAAAADRPPLTEIEMMLHDYQVAQELANNVPEGWDEGEWMPLDAYLDEARSGKISGLAAEFYSYTNQAARDKVAPTTPVKRPYRAIRLERMPQVTTAPDVQSVAIDMPAPKPVSPPAPTPAIPGHTISDIPYRSQRSRLPAALRRVNLIKYYDPQEFIPDAFLNGPETPKRNVFVPMDIPKRVPTAVHAPIAIAQTEVPRVRSPYRRIPLERMPADETSASAPVTLPQKIKRWAKSIVTLFRPR
jgi:hypothetical protein